MARSDHRYAAVESSAANRRRAALRIGPHGLNAFGDAPAVIASLGDAIDDFERLPPHIAQSQIARLTVEADFPRVPKSVSPNLAARSREIHERIVVRDADETRGLTARRRR